MTGDRPMAAQDGWCVGSARLGVFIVGMSVSEVFAYHGDVTELDSGDAVWTCVVTRLGDKQACDCRL